MKNVSVSQMFLALLDAASADHIIKPDEFNRFQQLSGMCSLPEAFKYVLIVVVRNVTTNT